MKTWMLATPWMLLTLGSGAWAQSKDALVGSWKLVSSTDTTEKGETRNSFGGGAVGFLTYTADGRMMVIISHAGRKPLSVPDYIGAAAEERSAAFSTFIAYAGTYTVEAQRVIHHVQVASLQNRVGTDQVRTIVKLEGERLILRTPLLLKDGQMITEELIWQRWKPESDGQGSSARVQKHSRLSDANRGSSSWCF